MRSAITLTTPLMILGLAAGRAAAHPGHGFGGGSFDLVHYATEPQHLGLGAAVALLAAISIAAVRKARALRPARAPRSRRAPHA